MGPTCIIYLQIMHAKSYNHILGILGRYNYPLLIEISSSKFIWITQITESVSRTPVLRSLTWPCYSFYNTLIKVSIYTLGILPQLIIINSSLDSITSINNASYGISIIQLTAIWRIINNIADQYVTIKSPHVIYNDYKVIQYNIMDISTIT